MNIKTLVIFQPIVLAFVMFIESFSNSVPVPILQVTELYNKSDVVIKGKAVIASVKDNTTMPWGDSKLAGKTIKVKLIVEDVIKGAPQPDQVYFDFFQPEAFLGFQSFHAKQIGIFFLKHAAASLSISDPYFISLPTVPSTEKSTLVGLDRVAVELANVIYSRNVSDSQKISAARALSTVNSAIVNNLLKKGFDLSAGQLKMEILSALLTRGDAASLPYAVSLILSPLPAANPNQLLQIAASIELGIHDPESLPHLTKLLKIKSVDIRRAIASAIRQTNSQNAIGSLSDLLADSDVEIRYTAVVGLAQLTGKYEWGPALDVFQSDERKYLNYWKNWSKQKVR